MTKKIGQMIKEARSLKGLSQAELAVLAGVSQAAVGHWERGTFVPRGKNLNTLSEILGIALQPEPSLTEFTVTDEEKISIDESESSSTVKDWAKGRFVSQQKARADEFEYLLARNLGNFETDYRIGAQNGGPSHDLWKVDLMSDRTVIEIRHPASYLRLSEFIERALWRLAFLKACFGDGMLYVAVIHRPPAPASPAAVLPSYERLITRLCAEADLVGIHLLLVDSPDDAAQAITDLENEMPHSE